MTRSERIVRQQEMTGGSGRRTVENSLIYVVDDVPHVTVAYTVLLEAVGYRVKAFNQRTEALATLKEDHEKPELLITDYIGVTMPVDRFIGLCLGVHHALRIMIASGFYQTDARIYGIKHDRFIQKPFTGEEFQRAVQGMLSSR